MTVQGGTARFGSPSLLLAMAAAGLLVLVSGGSIVWIAGLGVLVFAWFAQHPRVALYLMILMVPLQDALVLDGGGRAISITRVVGVAAFAAWLVNRLLAREPLLTSVRLHRAVLPIVLFILWASYSLLWAPSFARGTAFLLTFVQLLVWIVLMIQLLTRTEHVQRAIVVLVVGSMVSFGVALYQYFVLGVSRASGVTGGENAFGALAVFVIPFAFVLLLRDERRFQLLGTSALLGAILALGVSVSRTSLLLAPIVFLLVLYDSGKLRSHRVKVFLGAVVAAAMVPMLPWEAILYRFADAPEELTGAVEGSRGWRFGVAWQMFGEKPMAGVGIGGAEYRSGKYFVVHNAFLQVLAELGAIGLLLFTAVLAETWFALRRARKTRQGNNSAVGAYAGAARATYVGYLLYSMTVSNIDSRLLWFLVGLAAVLDGIARRIVAPRELDNATI